MRKPNIIWFMFDSLRNEFLNEFGCKEAERNFVDELISQGVSFTNCHGTAPFTIVSMASKMTGCYPSLNKLDGWLKKDPRKTINPLCLSLPEVLNYNGYKTFYMSSTATCTYVNPQGFNYYHAQYEYENFPLEEYIKAEEPKFIYIDFGDLHDMCCLNIGKFHKEDYIQGIKKTSEVIEKFYKIIKTDNDLILLTSDHGVRTLDDFSCKKYEGEYTTGRFLTEKTTRNSFNIIWPQKYQPKKIDFFCRGVDIYPTILDLLDFEYPHLDGISLKPIIEGKDMDTIKYAFCLTGWSNTHPMTPGAWCVKDGRYKLVITENKLGLKKVVTRELFDYIADKEEENDLSKQMPEKFKELSILAEKMFFTKRDIRKIYSDTNFNIDFYLKKREVNTNLDIVRYTDHLIHTYWEKSRNTFLKRHRRYMLKRILFYDFHWLYIVYSKIMNKSSKDIL